MTDTSTGSADVVTPAAINRLSQQAASQQESASTALALTPYEYGNAVSNPTAQDLHPSAQRLSSPQWAGKTSTLNNAQAAAGDADVYVTVPVDKVVTAGGSSKVAPVYASSKGYRSRPGESAGSIPPAVPAGRPY
jgi:hypothetical protein